MLINFLKEEEIKAITSYRKAYAYLDEGVHVINTFAPTEEILRVWNKEKIELFKLLGNNLILEKKFEYQKSSEELNRDIDEMLFNSESQCREFIVNYKAVAFENKEVKYELLSLLNPYNLEDNTYKGLPFKINFPNGRSYKVSNGCKISKALGKISNGFGIKNFEEFRIGYSQLLNQKKLTGNLVLSIHPIDYMTMSDNDCGWDSCMSWVREGEYRQGTVEMMNSPMVVVAYLKANKDMDFEGIPWGNKKWRQLFIVHEDVIVGIKEYPYYNNQLVETSLKWLKELAEQNLGRKYQKPTWIINEEAENKASNYEEKFAFRFLTDIMYNDFGCTPHGKHYMAVAEEIEPTSIQSDSWSADKYIAINYSGKNQCMVCGAYNTEFAQDSSLACLDCEEIYVCDNCQEPSTSLIEVNGRFLCGYCYEHYTSECEVCGSTVYNDDALNLYILPNLTKEEQENIYLKIWQDKSSYEKKEEYNFFSNANRFIICNEHCLADFEEKYLLKDLKTHKREWNYVDFYVYYDELNEEGRKFYCSNNSNEEYKEQFLNIRYAYQMI